MLHRQHVGGERRLAAMSPSLLDSPDVKACRMLLTWYLIPHCQCLTMCRHCSCKCKLHAHFSFGAAPTDVIIALHPADLFEGGADGAAGQDAHRAHGILSCRPAAVRTRLHCQAEVPPHSQGHCYSAGAPLSSAIIFVPCLLTHVGHATVIALHVGPSICPTLAARLKVDVKHPTDHGRALDQTLVFATKHFYSVRRLQPCASLSWACPY